MRTIVHKVRDKRTKKVTDTTLQVMGSDEYVAHHTGTYPIATETPAVPAIPVAEKQNVFKAKKETNGIGPAADNVS